MHEWQPGDRAYASQPYKKGKVTVFILRVLSRAAYGMVQCRLSCGTKQLLIPADCLYRNKEEAAGTCVQSQKEI